LGECLANLGLFKESENLLKLAYDTSNQKLHEKQAHVIVIELVELK